MRFLITAGGTREYIDPVRFISNASSGKMGYSLARAAMKAGHKVTLITAPTALREPEGAKIVKVETAGEMFEAVKRYFPICDCLIMAAAVSDYTPAAPAKSKIKKSGKAITLKLKATGDILKWAGVHKKAGQIVVGFALEDKALRVRAEKKMREKKLDMIIANTPAAISADDSSIHVKVRGGQWSEIGPARKTAIAGRMIRFIEGLA